MTLHRLLFCSGGLLYMTLNLKLRRREVRIDSNHIWVSVYYGTLNNLHPCILSFFSDPSVIHYWNGQRHPTFPLLAEGGKENTVGWRRAQLSALINHTGQLTPPPPPLLLADPLCAPLSAMCANHMERMLSFLTFNSNSKNNTLISFRCG